MAYCLIFSFLCRLIRQLKPPLIDVQKVLYDTYKATGGENALKPGSNLSAAISIECLLTMLELGLATKKFLSLVMSTIGYLLLSANVDFRYGHQGSARFSSKPLALYLILVSNPFLVTDMKGWHSFRTC